MPTARIQPTCTQRFLSSAPALATTPSSAAMSNAASTPSRRAMPALVSTTAHGELPTRPSSSVRAVRASAADKP